MSVFLFFTDSQGHRPRSPCVYRFKSSTFALFSLWVGITLCNFGFGPFSCPGGRVAFGLISFLFLRLVFSPTSFVFSFFSRCLRPVSQFSLMLRDSRRHSASSSLAFSVPLPRPRRPRPDPPSPSSSSRWSPSGVLRYFIVLQSSHSVRGVPNLRRVSVGACLVSRHFR